MNMVGFTMLTDYLRYQRRESKFFELNQMEQEYVDMETYRLAYPIETKHDEKYINPKVFIQDEGEIRKIPVCTIKPALSYAQLITMALKDSSEKQMTLSQIYNWIMDKYEYYRIADPVWQNSIRHNLSLNKCFKKIARPGNTPGKGGFWALDEEYILKKEEHSRKRKQSECLDVKRQIMN
ncbi:Forkhead box protein J1.2 [Astathelohania contejeani]|uniref:Forkhead box protein J1.2 n=1 Tax=Astathelohania contejeani TaxID=164912 RepID=A0ABQ7HZB9_9MICR|nr:Forkhead box protein J1.2 [Thelohania contejeani]